MRKFLLFFSCLFLISFIKAQNIQIENLRQLKLKGKNNYRNVLLSPNGRFLSYIIINNKNHYQYIYDLEKDESFKLGNSLSSNNDFLSGASKQERTDQLCWLYEKKYDELYFDFIHVVSMGKENLYTGTIRLKNPDLSVYQGKDIPQNKKFRNYPKIEEQGFIQIFYPSFGHTIDYVGRAPRFYVVFTVDRRLAFFDHQRYGMYKSVFQAKKEDKEQQEKEIYSDLLPKFSPNDKYLVFIREYNKNSDILLASREGRQGRFFSKEDIRIIAGSPSIETSPEWSPDGTKIAYYSDEGHSQKYSIWMYNVKIGERVELVTNVNRNDSRNKGPQWVGNEGIIFVANDIQLKDPLMYYHIPSKKMIRLQTKTASNLDISVVQLKDGVYRVAFTSRGSVEKKDELVWTKIYVMDLLIED